MAYKNSRDTVSIAIDITKDTGEKYKYNFSKMMLGIIPLRVPKETNDIFVLFG